MSFASVFKSLQELFPQVDRRMLKAVAIEHTKDVDAAVEFILNEVLPSISSPSKSPHAPIDDNHPTSCNTESPHTHYPDVGSLSSAQIQIGEQRDFSQHLVASEEATEGPSDSRFLSSKHSDDSHHSSQASDVRSTLAEERTVPSELRSITSDGYGSHHTIEAPDGSSTCLDELVVSPVMNEPAAYDTDLSVSIDRVHVESCSKSNLNEIENVQVQLDSYLHDESEELMKDASESEILSSSGNKRTDQMVQETEDEAKELVEDASESEIPSSGNKRMEQMVQESEVAHLEDDSFSTAVNKTQSGQICRINVLEDAINEAKNNKKTLFSSMDSVIKMMREVEDLEKAAEHAKQEAVRGGLDILLKVEELRKMLLHAKEANDMHAGEVYGEKAILATEARELQSRLLNLSYERDRSLSILDEMRQALEARLVAAEEARKAAELDKLEKEGSARKALVEQELIMEKVVQESKRLQSEADENSKLREFLMDRGHVVDILQGEIAVICKDVKLLKENFDERVPLSKSLSSSQTSCILASSGSSSGKSLASSLVPEQVESLETPTLTSVTLYEEFLNKSTSEFPESVAPFEEYLVKSASEGSDSTSKKPMDDDWEMFEEEADELYNSNH